MMLRKHLLEKNQENEPSKLVLSKRSDKNLRRKEKEATDTSGFKAEDDKHDRLTNEMLQLAKNMKQNVTIAGNVIKDDNLNLEAMHRTVSANRENLTHEDQRLEHHAL